MFSAARQAIAFSWKVFAGSANVVGRYAPGSAQLKWGWNTTWAPCRTAHRTVSG